MPERKVPGYMTLWEIATEVCGSKSDAPWVSDPKVWPDWNGPDYVTKGEGFPCMTEANAQRYIAFLRPKWAERLESKRRARETRARINANRQRPQRPQPPPPEPKPKSALPWRITSDRLYYNLDGSNAPEWCERIVMVLKPGDRRLKIFGLKTGYDFPLVLGSLKIWAEHMIEKSNHIQVNLTKKEAEGLRA